VYLLKFRGMFGCSQSSYNAMSFMFRDHQADTLTAAVAKSDNGINVQKMRLA